MTQLISLEDKIDDVDINEIVDNILQQLNNNTFGVEQLRYVDK